jgi:hypothetical protein
MADHGEIVGHLHPSLSAYDWWKDFLWRVVAVLGKRGHKGPRECAEDVGYSSRAGNRRLEATSQSRRPALLKPTFSVENWATRIILKFTGWMCVLVHQMRGERRRTLSPWAPFRTSLSHVRVPFQNFSFRGSHCSKWVPGAGCLQS